MRLLKLSALLLSLTLAACGGGSSKPATSSTTPPPATAKSNDMACPMEVSGTSVTVEDTATGAALVFVTTGDVAEVRRRVAAMAKMHNDHHGAMGALPDGSGGGGHEGHDMSKMGGGHEGHDMSKMGGGHEGHDMSGHDMSGHDMGGMMSVHSKAEASDIEGGAKLTFTANPGDVAKLQSELRMHAQHMSSGMCKMGKS